MATKTFVSKMTLSFIVPTPTTRIADGDAPFGVRDFLEGAQTPEGAELIMPTNNFATNRNAAEAECIRRNALAGFISKNGRDFVSIEEFNEEMEFWKADGADSQVIAEYNAALANYNAIRELAG